MKPIILDGKKLAKEIEEELKLRVKKLKEKTGIVPSLAIILIGENPASEIYVKLKLGACERIGVKAKLIRLAEKATTEDVIKIIENCNQDNEINGILFQHPAPKQIDEEKCLRTIVSGKDVDGLNPMSDFKAATPLGIITLLKHYYIKIEGKEAVVVGRSRILGKPMAMMFLEENATVTICHSKTKDLPKIIKRADILVAAIGKPKFIQGEWIKGGAVVVDAGYNPGNVGDVDLEKAVKKCSAYTPVPGGVGPMTIISLVGQVIGVAEKL
jgi:methylenetetrahydrofolate dehydrogenase (NADP+)/methenyltetrahydrofolate cyclohydrolase